MVLEFDPLAEDARYAGLFSLDSLDSVFENFVLVVLAAAAAELPRPVSCDEVREDADVEFLCVLLFCRWPEDEDW